MTDHQHHKSNTTARQSPYQLVCDRLRAHGSKHRQKGLHKSNWSCPVCDDRDFHLGVEEVAEGNVLLHCFHGCSPDAIVAALGLRLADLFAEKRKGDWPDEPLTLRAYLQAKKLDAEIAQAAGLTDGFDEYERPCLLIPYRDENGKQIALHYRYRLEGGEKGRFGWPKGTKAKGLLYGRERLPEARAAKRALLFEGESDPHTCWQHEFPAFGVPGADMVNPKRLAKDFAGIERLYIGNERDKGAPAFLRSLAAADGLAERVWVLDLSPYKDPSEVHIALGDGFTGFMRAAMEKARPLPEVLPALDAAASTARQRAAGGEPVLPEAGSAGRASGEGNVTRRPRSDSGNAEMLCDRYGDLLRFRFGPEDWLWWDGMRWRPDSGGEAQKLALQAARIRYHEAPNIPDQKEREAESRWAVGSESARRIRDALACAAKAIVGFGHPAAAFDANPMLVCCRNGVADLETGKLLPHDRGLLLTKLAGTEYVRRTRNERWEKFLREIFLGDEAMIAFVQRLAGYSLTGCVQEHVFAFCHGGGANGKSVFLNALRAAFGEYALAGQFSTFTTDREKRGGPREDLARLHGARLFTCIEASGTARFSEATVKATTSSDPIVADYKYGHVFEFAPTHHTWLAANVKPRVADPTAGFWRRLLFVPFEAEFPEGVADRQLEEKLRGEALPAVLAWCIEGALAWRADGLNPPRKVQIATAAYRAREDLVGRFLEECVTLDPEAEVGATNLYQAYVAYCNRMGEKARTQAEFGEEMARHSHPSERATAGPNRGRMRYRGLRLDTEVGVEE